MTWWNGRSVVDNRFPKQAKLAGSPKFNGTYEGGGSCLNFVDCISTEDSLDELSALDESESLSESEESEEVSKELPSSGLDSESEDIAELLSLSCSVIERSPASLLFFAFTTSKRLR